MHMKVANANLERAHRFEKALLKIRADTHRFARRLHLRAELIGYGGEFVEGESRELRYDVVKARLKRRLRACNLNLVKSHTECNFRGHSRDRITRCLRCKSRASRHSGVNLNEIIFGGIGV